MKVHERFCYSELEKIFEGTDILIAPSIWYETYGFTVLEALSFGVPVLVSAHVGAKDLLEDGKYGIVCEPDVRQLEENIRKLIVNRKILEMYNQKITEEFDLKTVMQSFDKIEKIYVES